MRPPKGSGSTVVWSSTKGRYMTVMLRFEGQAFVPKVVLKVVMND